MARIGRRRVLQGGLGLGIGLSLEFVASGQDDPAAVRPKPGDLLVRDGDSTAAPLVPDDIAVGARPVVAWAMDRDDGTVRNGSRLNRILVLRVDDTTISADTRSRAASGVLAFTAVCTHTGCEVTDWLGDIQLLQCPCHYSKFDPKDGAKVVDGPAPRPLAALPIGVVDGRLVVARPFTSRVGFEPA